MNKSICPLCQTNNHCMVDSEKTCWCNDMDIPQELLELVSDKHRGKVCICHSCIEKFNTRSTFNKTD